MSDNSIIVQGLKKYYGSIKAVDGINFQVKSGTIFGMLGPNGAGKTTTIETLVGLNQRDQGQVQIMGLDPETNLQKLKTKIGVQLQSPSLFPRLTVSEILQLFASFYPEPKEVDDVLARIGLEEKAGDQVKSLSGGQQHRLAVGLAIISNGDVVFLDEPTTGLDPKARRQLWKVIQDLKKQGMTVFLTTHYMDEAEQLCDDLVIIDRGLTQRPQIFTIDTETVQAQRLSNFDYILPGILAMALMQLGLFGSFQFLSLREQKIIRGLGVTPLPRSTILSSEILVRLIVALIQTFLIVIIGQTVFGVTIVGNLFKMSGIVILGSLTFISLGYMLISFASSMESGRGIVQVVQFPMMFLSGIFFPVEIMPDYIKPVVKAIPLTYLGDALRQEMVGATPAYSMTTNLLVLTAWLVVTLMMAVKFWKWE